MSQLDQCGTSALQEWLESTFCWYVMSSCCSILLRGAIVHTIVMLSCNALQCWSSCYQCFPDTSFLHAATKLPEGVNKSTNAATSGLHGIASWTQIGHFQQSLLHAGIVDHNLRADVCSSLH